MLDEMTVAELYEFGDSDIYDKLYKCENYCKPCIKKKIFINLIEHKINEIPNEQSTMDELIMISDQMNYNMSYDEMTVMENEVNEIFDLSDFQIGECK